MLEYERREIERKWSEGFPYDLVEGFDRFLMLLKILDDKRKFYEVERLDFLEFKGKDYNK